MAHQAITTGQVHELALEADQTTGRNTVFDTDAATAIRHHVLQVTLALTQRFHHATLGVFFNVHRQHFVRFTLNTVDHLLNDARPTHSQLVTFTAHVFQQDAEVKFATPCYVEDVTVGGIFNAQRHVGQ